MEHFKDHAQTIAFALEELASTLEDDLLDTRENDDDPSLEAELEAKAADLREADGVVEALWDALSDIVEDDEAVISAGQRKAALAAIEKAQGCVEVQG